MSAFAEARTMTTEVRALVRRRKRLEATVERALAALDEMDGDPDLEDGGDLEPSLCGVSAQAAPMFSPDAYDLRLGFVYAMDDREGDEFGQDEALEPSLGSLGLHASFDQRRWSEGDTSECEGCEHDGREPDEDGEPELGSHEEGRGGTSWALTQPRILDGEVGDAPGDEIALANAARRRCRSRRVYSHGPMVPRAKATIVRASKLSHSVLDPDDDADTIGGPRAEWGMAR